MKFLVDFGFKVGAEIPEMVSYEGRLYPVMILYLDLRDKYEFEYTP